jgi:hypothetical protein
MLIIQLTRRLKNKIRMIPSQSCAGEDGRLCALALSARDACRRASVSSKCHRPITFMACSFADGLHRSHQRQKRVRFSVAMVWYFQMMGLIALTGQFACD